jgi:hypothetical protein
MRLHTRQESPQYCDEGRMHIVLIEYAVPVKPAQLIKMFLYETYSKSI